MEMLYAFRANDYLWSISQWRLDGRWKKTSNIFCIFIFHLFFIYNWSSEIYIYIIQLYGKACDHMTSQYTLGVFIYSFFISVYTAAINVLQSTGCLLNIVFFLKISKYSRLLPFTVFPRCQCVYTHQAGRTPALQQNWQSSEKSQHFKEKNTIFNKHPVTVIIYE